MANPAHYMYAVNMPAVTTARTSVDYLAGTPKVLYWPQFFQVNMLAWAVGVLPFKDNFQSSPGQREILSERMGEQEALISSLSAGMVGPSDRIGFSDAELLNRTCRRDGLLLKPDRPATPLDAMFLEHQRPYLVSTHSQRPGIGTWTYLAAFHLARGGTLMQALDKIANFIVYESPIEEMFVFPREVRDWHVDLQDDLNIDSSMVAFNWRTGTAVLIRDTFQIPPVENRTGYAYFVLAPVLSNGLALIGEPEKFVTLADKRFLHIEALPNGIRIHVQGVPGEDLAFLAYDTLAGQMLDKVEAVLGPSGEAELLLSR